MFCQRGTTSTLFDEIVITYYTNGTVVPCNDPRTTRVAMNKVHLTNSAKASP